MSLKKRNGSPYWWTDFTVAGQRVRESTGTVDRKLAEQYEAKRKAGLWEQYRLGVKARRSWKEAVVRWLSETTHKRSRRDDILHLRWLDAHLGHLDLQDIDRETIDAVMQARIETGVSNGTVNRSLAVLRAILRRAEREWEWIDRAPVVRKLPEPARRVRWLRPDEAERLLAELPEHLSVMAEFTLETGLRASNVKGLRWDQVDMPRRCAWIEAQESKSSRAIAIPLSRRAADLIRSQIGRHQEFVFTFRDEPIRGQLTTKAWRKALERAGIEDFRWHDLRHTWASWHIQRGTPTAALQEMGGWADAGMVRRYAHLSADHLIAYADGTNRAQ